MDWELIKALKRQFTNVQLDKQTNLFQKSIDQKGLQVAL